MAKTTINVPSIFLPFALHVILQNLVRDIKQIIYMTYTSARMKQIHMKFNTYLHWPMTYLNTSNRLQIYTSGPLTKSMLLTTKIYHPK